jgi:HSP20 family protein
MIGFWDEIADLERRMDEVVRRMIGPHSHLAFPTLPLFVRKPFIPPVDVHTKGKDLVVRVELPGIDPARDLHIGIDGSELVVRGERKQTDESTGAYYLMESASGVFERRIPIPDGVDESAVNAEYVDGVLTVTLPEAAKATGSVAKEIRVKTIKSTMAA